MSSYKTLRRANFLRIVAWYGGAINRAADHYGQRLADAAAQHKGFGPEQRQAIEEEFQDFARKKPPVISTELYTGWQETARESLSV
jgi:hypothetical protein